MLNRKYPARQSTCLFCGGSMDKAVPQARYCSQRCRWDAGHRRQTNQARQAKRDAGLPLPGDVVLCENPQCFNAAVYFASRAFCSDTCQNYFQSNKHWLGEGPSCRIYIRLCPDCDAPVTMRHKGGTIRVCKVCRVIRNQAINARKNHARRTAGPPALSVNEIAARDGCRCHICNCKVDMTLSGMAKWGPTIEHIVPVSHGGTNEPANLALAHRYCNTARGNQGHSQLTLVA